jgi:hypothetical protein
MSAKAGSGSSTTANDPVRRHPIASPTSRGGRRTRPSLLEREPALSGKLRFATDELLSGSTIASRPPKKESTFASVEQEREALARRIFAGPSEVSPAGSPKDLFSVRLTTETTASLAALLERAGGPLQTP